MYIQPALLPQAKKIRASPVLSREATRRLRWMEYYLSHGRNAKLTYRHFGISSATFYRWWHRYDPRRLESLEDDWGTRRPHAVRQPETPPALEAAIRTVREHYPRWGKVKLRLLLRRHGCCARRSHGLGFPSGRSRLMADRNSRRRLKRPAPSFGSNCLCSRRALRGSMGMWSGPIGRIRRSSTTSLRSLSCWRGTTP